jgi:hypothetical protein
MLSLKVDGKTVDIGDDFSFTMNLKSPMFNDVGGYSYPFKLPGTLRNKRIFDFTNRPGSTGDVFKKMPGVFYWGSHPLFGGILPMKVMNGSSFEGAMIESLGDYYYNAKQLNLEQVDFGGMQFASELAAINYLNNTPLASYPGYKFACPIFINEKYFDPPTDNPHLYLMNDWHNGEGLKLETTVSGKKNPIMPMLFMQYVFDRIARQLGFTLIDHLFAPDSDLAKLVLWNNTSCNGADYANTTITDIRFAKHVPRMPLPEFISSVEKFFCSFTFIDSMNKKMRIVPFVKLYEDPSFVEFSSNILDISVEPADEIEGYEIRSTLDGDDPVIQDDLLIKGNDEALALNFKGSVKTYYDLPWYPEAVEGDIYFVEDTVKLYYLNPMTNQWEDVSDEKFLFSFFRFRNPKQKSETKMNTLYYDRLYDWPGSLDSGIIRCENKAVDWDKISPRLLFAVNRMDISGTGMITDGEIFTGDRSLYFWDGYFGGDKCMFNKFWLTWAKFKVRTRLVKITKKMDLQDLYNFDFSKKYMINGTKYFVGSIQTAIKKNNIMPSLLECYPVD